MHIKVGFNKVRNLILVVIFAVGIFAGGYYLGVKGYQLQITKALQISINQATPPDVNANMDLFWTVWKDLSDKYYDKSKLVPSQMVDGAIEGMVSALGDPYTMYLPASENKIVNDNLSGSFEGVGIEIGIKDSKLVVIAPLTGSPAEAAGVKAGDYITHITDTQKGLDVDTTGLGIDEAVTDIKGPAGTKVSLTLMRGTDPKPIVAEITRAKINVPSVSLSWVGSGSDIADIKISEFGAETTDEWSKTVTQVLQKGDAKGIIIDLRNNPGGYMQSAVDIASDFISSGTTVVIQQDGDGTKTSTPSEDLHQRLMNYKVVVLINGGSASASEILSGALRDDRGIKLVGDKSFGKGTIQDPEDIPGGAGLHITIAKWLTPDGTWVHGKGLTPDVAVANSDNSTVDDQLNAAIKLFQ
ncbi:MAG: S41 family peptidase [Candidatus Microgenomates bacterium]|jgi:carboxyl-terminal processing protease